MEDRLQSIPILYRLPIKPDLFGKNGRDKMEAFVPEYNFTVYGEDYLELVSQLIMHISAMQEYYAQHNIPVPEVPGYDDVYKMISGKNEFVSYLPLDELEV